MSLNFWHIHSHTRLFLVLCYTNINVHEPDKISLNYLLNFRFTDNNIVQGHRGAAKK